MAGRVKRFMMSLYTFMSVSAVLSSCDRDFFEQLKIEFSSVMGEDGQNAKEDNGVMGDELISNSGDVEGKKNETPQTTQNQGSTIEGKSAKVYGKVTRFQVPVFEKPLLKAKQIGSLRRGGVLPVEVIMKKDSDCPEGWVYLPKGKGYACLGHGIKINDKLSEDDQDSIHAPWYDSLLPYDYGRIGKDDLPAYNRIPTAEEAKQVHSWLAQRRAILNARLEALTKAMEEGKPVPNPYETLTMEISGNTDEFSTQNETGKTLVPVEEGPVPTIIPFKFVEKVLIHGFYISIGSKNLKSKGGWLKTVRGFFVPSGSISIKSPPSTRGIELNGLQDLPVIFVKRTSVAIYMLDEKGNPKLNSGRKLSRFDSSVVLEKLDFSGAEFLKIGENEYVRKSEVTLVEKQKPPSVVKSPDQKWIDVDVSKQVLVAYQGTKAVYAALVSTGREKENEEFKTPRGVFSILSKHVTGTMANLYASDGPYMIEDVPWTMYFLGSFALHGAFWHNSFGSMRSHGCVNLPPFDARWIFYWSEPLMPEGWHTVYSTSDRPGTIIRIRD